MKIERPNRQPLSPAELQNLEKLKTLIESVIADGTISGAEMESIKAAIASDGKVTFEKLQLCQELIWQKIHNGELDYNW